MEEGSGSLWLVGSGGGCNLFAETEHTVRVSTDGFLSGDFVVPGRGSSRMPTVEDVVVTPGPYRIAYQCTACTIGTFEVTASPSPPSVQCQTIGFTPQSEDAASSIVATNVSCAEAEAMVRKVGTMIGVLNGPTRAQADGFTCERTSQLEEPLPRAKLPVHERRQAGDVRALLIVRRPGTMPELPGTNNIVGALQEVSHPLRRSR